MGTGGVGSSASYYLAQSGIGHLRLIDQDIVEPSNLHRMPELGRAALYHPKADAVAESLMRRIPSLSIEPVVETLRSTNADEFLADSDVLVDGLDNFRTRYIVNRFSVKTGTPYVFTSAIQNQGHVGVFEPPRTACLECRFRNVVDGPQDACEALGVTAAITGIVGAFAASETVKILLSTESNHQSKLVTVDSATMNFYKMDIVKNDRCAECAKSNNHPSERASETLVELCGGKTFNVLPRSRLQIDLRRAAARIPRSSILNATNNVLVCQRGQIIVSLFRNGRVLVEGVADGDEAIRIALETAGPAVDLASPEISTG